MDLRTTRDELAVCRKRPDGFTLVEALVAMLILAFALVSLAHLFGVVIFLNKNHGKDAAKTGAFAHDKIDELAALAFGDTTTNVTVNPPYPANGKGLSAGGSNPPATPVSNYVDYLDRNGIRTTSPNASFTRQWQISDDSAALKRITVTVTANTRFEGRSAAVTVLATYKTR